MNRRQLLLRLACAPGLAAGFSALPAWADDDAQQRAKAEADQAAALAAGEIGHWDFRLRDAKKTAIALDPHPVLRWTNPGSGRVYGSVFLGTALGRPEVVFAVYKWYDPYHGFEAEMQSLSLSGLEARREETDIWHPERPGVELRDIPEAPAVASSASARNRQLGPLAQRFSATLVKTPNGQTEQPLALRLLPKPIHRYQGPGAGADPIDGGVFAFVQGTDPELFLLIEARTAGASPRWQYGLARMCRGQLRVDCGGREVWRVPQIDGRHDRSETYFNMDLPRPPGLPLD